MSAKKPTPSERVNSQNANEDKVLASRRVAGGGEPINNKSPQKNGPTSPMRTASEVT